MKTNGVPRRALPAILATAAIGLGSYAILGPYGGHHGPPGAARTGAPAGTTEPSRSPGRPSGTAGPSRVVGAGQIAQTGGTARADHVSRTGSSGVRFPAASQVSHHGRSSSRPAASRTATPRAVAFIGASGSSLIIPSIGVDAPLLPTGAVGAPGSASLTVPSDIHTVGWWDGLVSDGGGVVREDAPRPGQPGVALIAGHIDSAVAGPGALYDLGEVKTGDLIEVVGSNGRTTMWRASRPPQTALKTELPPALWVTTGRPQLALVTCGGPFDASTGHYLDNVIVWASLATTSGARST